MTDLPDDEPYLTFSEDWGFAFVERGPGAETAVEALRWFERRLLDAERPLVPPIRSWRPRRARLLGLELWNEQDGTCLARTEPGTRALWRIDVSGALELEPPGETDEGRLLGHLVALRYQGRLSEADLVKAELLFTAVEEAEAARRERQAARRADAPRAHLDEGAGALLGRLVTMLVSILGAEPGPQGEDAERALRALRQRLAAEEERQVRALRAELGGPELRLG